MRNLYILLILMACHQIYAQTWTGLTTLPGSYSTRSSSVGASVGNKAYFGLGWSRNSNGQVILLKDFWEYDVVTNVWTQKADFPGAARFGAVAFAIGSNLYVGTGSITSNFPFNGTPTNDFYVYNTLTNTWSSIPNFPEVRGEASAFVINGKGYVSCGEALSDGISDARQDLYMYDPVALTWTKEASLPGYSDNDPNSGRIRRFSAMGFSINNKGYLGGGIKADGTYCNDFFEYDPTTNIWISKPWLPGSPPGFAQAMYMSTCTRGFVMCGSYATNYYTYPLTLTKSVYEYDPVASAWSQQPDFINTCWGGTGWQINGTLYAGFGSFWKSSPLYIIINPSVICTTGSFSVQNQPPGSSISWSSNQSYFTLSPTTGASTTGTRLNSFNGAPIITATISEVCGSTTVSPPIWVGMPLITDWSIDGIHTSQLAVCPGGHTLTVTPTGGNASNAAWIVPSGIQYSVGQNNLGINIRPPMPSSIAIKAYSSNDCGAGPQLTFTLIKKTSGCPASFAVSASPNPATSDLTVEMIAANPTTGSADEPATIDEAILFDNSQNMVRSSYGGAKRIVFNVRGLKKGEYYLHVSVGGELYTKHIAIE
jgi:hypothetical protein